jgi:hypothetical protein
MKMQEQDAPLTRTEADHRRELLGRLQDALAEQRITSALAGRRTLVLHSAREATGRGYREPAKPADPRLYVFDAGGTHIVTTDGEVYWLTGSYPHSVADPCGAALAYARWSTE